MAYSNPSKTVHVADDGTVTETTTTYGPDGPTTTVTQTPPEPYDPGIIDAYHPGEPPLDPAHDDITFIHDGDIYVNGEIRPANDVFPEASSARPEEPAAPSKLNPSDGVHGLSEPTTEPEINTPSPRSSSAIGQTDPGLTDSHGSLSHFSESGTPSETEEFPSTGNRGKGNAIDNNPELGGPSKPGTVQNPDGSITTTEIQENIGNLGKTKTITKTTKYPDHTEITKTHFDAQNNQTGSSTERIEGNVTNHQTFDANGDPTHQTTKIDEGDTVTTHHFDGNVRPAGKSVSETKGDTTINTDYDANNNITYRQETTQVRDENGNVVGIKQVITERQADGSVTRTTETFDVDQSGGRYLDSSNVETISGPANQPESSNQAGSSNQARPSRNMFGKIRHIFRKKGL
jgi:hypothetical protein